MTAERTKDELFPVIFFVFKLVHEGIPPCRDMSLAKGKAIESHQKSRERGDQRTVASKNKLSKPVTLYPNSSIYLHCDSAEGCLEFIRTYPDLGITSICPRQPAGSIFERVSSRGLRSKLEHSSKIDGRKTATKISKPRKKMCAVDGCGFSANHNEMLSNHMRKKHGGPLNGKCPVKGCYHFTTRKKAREEHWNKEHSDTEMWQVNYTME